jgi:hypothetical protein
MRWHRRPTQRQLLSWLEHGTPSSVERWIDDPQITEELERLTQLSAHDTHAIRIAVEPTTGFHERTTDAVRSRVDDLERLGVLIGLLGLGPRIARSLIDPDNK